MQIISELFFDFIGRLAIFIPLIPILLIIVIIKMVAKHENDKKESKGSDID